MALLAVFCPPIRLQLRNWQQTTGRDEEKEVNLAQSFDGEDCEEEVVMPVCAFKLENEEIRRI